MFGCLEFLFFCERLEVRSRRPCGLVRGSDECISISPSLNLACAAGKKSGEFPQPTATIDPVPLMDASLEIFHL